MMYLKEGFIVQQDGDFGDTAHRHGWFQLAITLRWCRELPELHKDYGVIDFGKAYHSLSMPENPKRSPWGNGNAGKFSRDQAVPTLCYLRLSSQIFEQEMWKYQLKRNSPVGLRFSNGDICTPQVECLLERKTPSTMSLLELLSNVILCSTKVRLNSDDTDQTLNTFAIFSTLYTKYPKSKILGMCKNVFKSYHPGVQQALNSYFRPEMGGNIELAEVWEPIVQDILK